MAAISVNDLVDRLDELQGKPIEVVGILTWETENCALWHFPKAERRGVSESDPPVERSSVWLSFGTGSLQPNERALKRWHGKRVSATGVVYGPRGPGGCGHFGGWGCEIEPYSIQRI